MKSKIFAAALLLGATTLPMAAFAAPQLTIQSEQAGHPRIAKSIKDMEETYQLLEKAPEDFGGNKARAMSDLHQAIHSLKRALYHRLKLDDAAIDRAQ